MKNIISIDETSIDTHLCNKYGWSKKGTKIENIIKETRIRYSLILAINCNKIIHKQIVKGSANGEIFLKFIKDLINKMHKGDNKYILLDNAKIHHYGKIKEFINKEPKIKLIYNLPYTPETNPIERVFNDVKRNLRKNKINKNNIIDKINTSLNEINNNNFKAYYDKSLINEISKL